MKLPVSKTARVILVILAAFIGLFLFIIVIMSVRDFNPPRKVSLEMENNAMKVPPNLREFTIATWNLGYFGLGEKMDFFYDGGKMVRPAKKDYYQIANDGESYIAAMRAVDFLLFQEVDRDSKRSYHDDQYGSLCKILWSHSAAFAINYDVLFVPVPLMKPMGRVFGGVATFSRFIPDEIYRGALPGSFAWPTNLFMLDRCFIFTRINLAPGKDLVLINTHNEAFDEGNMREVQMELLRTVMITEYEKGHYVVAGGDWNMNPAGYTEKQFSTGDLAMTILPENDKNIFPDGWKWVFDPEIPSNRKVDQIYERSKTPTTIIDYFITSPNVEIMEIRTVDLGFRWSDHQPVVMKFSCTEN